LKRDLDWTPSDNDTGYYHDVRLCGSLYEASINSVPEYFALSYTWGDPTVCEYIILDGTRFGIGANCAAALRRMLRGKMDVHIWVDAICINQADTPDALDERSSQVAMMDKIYKASSRVNVHLSEGDRDTDVAMQLLKKLATAYLGAKMGSKQSRKEYERLADDVLGQYTLSYHVAFGTNDIRQSRRESTPTESFIQYSACLGSDVFGYVNILFSRTYNLADAFRWSKRWP
jgi:hypothetical protein